MFCVLLGCSFKEALLKTVGALNEFESKKKSRYDTKKPKYQLDLETEVSTYESISTTDF